MSAVADRRYAELQLEAARSARNRLTKRVRKVFGKKKGGVLIQRIKRVSADTALRFEQDNPDLFESRSHRRRG